MTSGGRGSWPRSAVPSLNVERSQRFLDDCERLGIGRARIAHIVRAVMTQAEADPHLEVVVLGSLPAERGTIRRPRVALVRVGDNVTLIGIADS